MSYLAIDLGAGSGRAIAGTFSNGKIELTEVFRFPNVPVKLNDTLYWNFLTLMTNVKESIRQAIIQGYQLKGIAVDTWGGDFGLLDESGMLLSNPVCYRDIRTRGMCEEMEELISKEDMYSMTGIQAMEINTIFQLLSMIKSKSPLLSIARKILFMPDLINHYLTGISHTEYTIASTSQLLNVTSGGWEQSIFNHLEISPLLMQDIIQPSSFWGNLSPSLSTETGAENLKVFSVASHDTASAIAAIPEEGEDWAFLSSGTWSLLGVVTDKPILTDQARLADFTNEGGANGKILFLRNITGLWLLQRLLDEWRTNEGIIYSYDYLLEECKNSPVFRSTIDCDYPSFVNPLSMIKAIQDYCRNTNQPEPETKGQFVRCIFESLAIKYRDVMDCLQQITGKKYNRLFVVGGGSQNQFLNQCIADILGIEVITGLTESTAIGNIVQQAIANNELSGWKEARQVIYNTFSLTSYLPRKE